MTAYDDVIAELDEIAAADTPWRSDRFFTYIFNSSDEVVRLGHQAYERFSGANGLDPTVFGSFVRFENDLVQFCRGLVHGSADVVGSFTSGGTESIILALKAARDARRAALGDGRTVNLVIPDSAHAAFHKAAHFLDVELRVVPTQDDFRVNPDRLLAATDDDTAMVAVSAPQFAHGVVDPITAIGERTQVRDLWLHVDACMGGLTMPFIAGAPAFGFDVPGVRSISLDLHKYGYTTKGASIALYADAAHRRWQFSSAANWTGYPVVNTTIQSTKSGGPLAAAWAVVRYLGREGYATAAEQARTAATGLADFARTHDFLQPTSTPDATLVSLETTPEAPGDVFDLSAGMRERGWNVGPTPGFANSPPHLHFTMTATHAGLLPELCADLDESVRAGSATSPSIPEGMDLDGDPADILPALMAGVDLSDRGAIDATINALPPALRTAAIAATFEMLFTPPPPPPPAR